jgi:glycosyltransferase involved in cell wall biosynthesis
MRVSVIDELAFLRGHGASIGAKLVMSLEESPVKAQLVAVPRESKFTISLLKHSPNLRELFIIPAIGSRLIKRCEGMSDVLHISNTATTAMFDSKKPTLVTVHCGLSRQIAIFRDKLPDSYGLAFNTLTYRMFLNLERRGLQNVDLVMAPRKDLRDFIVQKLGVPSKKVRIVYLGIETERFNPMDLEKRFDILFVGRGSIAKGFDTLLEAIPDIEGKVGIVTTNISEAYRDKVANTENLTVLGEVSHGAMQELYNSARIFVMPSLSEVCPQVTLEAMACGLPIVCTEQGGGDFVRDGKEGVIIPDRDPARLVKAVNDLLSDENKMRTMGETSRATVLSDFNWNKTVTEIRGLYEELI